MATQAIGTILLLIVFMIAFSYFLNTLFFRQIEKKEKHTNKDSDNLKNH